MIRYFKMPFKRQRYNFVKVMEDLFWGNKMIPRFLNQLHFKLKEEHNELFEVGKDSSTSLHQRFYDQYRAGWTEMESLYEKFIREFVSKQFDEDFLYQSFPTVRFHIPGNVAVGKYHNDSEFGHPEGEINFIIPLTDSDDTASVWLESEPGLGDFQAIKLQLGVLVMFNGNKLTHGNKVNMTNNTRVSMDFRILPISKYNPDQSGFSITTNTKFVEGQYFKRFTK